MNGPVVVLLLAGRGQVRTAGWSSPIPTEYCTSSRHGSADC